MRGAGQVVLWRQRCWVMERRESASGLGKDVQHGSGSTCKKGQIGYLR